MAETRTHTHTHESSALVCSQPLQRIGAEAPWSSPVLLQSPMGTSGAGHVPSTTPTFAEHGAASSTEPRGTSDAPERSLGHSAGTEQDTRALQQTTPPGTFDHP